MAEDKGEEEAQILGDSLEVGGKQQDSEYRYPDCQEVITPSTMSNIL